jgi:hypothetical protein
MRSRRGVYDPALFEQFAAVLGQDDASDRVHELGVLQLRPGMKLAGDVRGSGGTLLVARGHEVTLGLVERLTNLGRDQIREPLLVVVDTPDGWPDETRI